MFGSWTQKDWIALPEGQEKKDSKEKNNGEVRDTRTPCLSDKMNTPSQGISLKRTQSGIIYGVGGGGVQWALFC